MRLWKIACITYIYGLQSVNAGYKLLKGKREEVNAFFRATKDALNFIM